MLTGGLLVLAACGGGTRVVTKTVTGTTPPARTAKPRPAPSSGPSATAVAAAHAFAATIIGDNATQVISPVGASVFATAAAAATMSTATTAVAGHGGRGGGGGKPAGPTQRVVSGQASGQYAVAYTNGTFHHPSAIVLNVSASPPQPGSVDWNVVCFELSGGIGRKEGRATVALPTTKTLPLPAPSSTCIGSANVQLSKSGTVTISISG
ncbi:MAG TPA: hypothetical protein VG295_03130 [Solirubrobacteraceae bacterium]|jgi:hypothetical protein|nr:hypothetical protein [Solirubrobacteraceae bacterium]